MGAARLWVTDSDGGLGQTVRHFRGARPRGGSAMVSGGGLAVLTEGFDGGFTDGLAGNCPSMKGL